MLFKYWVVCLLLFILFIQARASSFMPAVTNYLAKDYEAGYQNWACAQGSNGEMYFGNSQGLLVYDGYRWTLHKVPGNHIVRSVYVKEDRIYVGAFEEFGYFKYSEAGTLRYHSLSKFLKNFPMENNHRVCPLRGSARDAGACRCGAGQEAGQSGRERRRLNGKRQLPQSAAQTAPSPRELAESSGSD